MIDHIIPARYIYNPLSTTLWIWLCVGNFHLYIFTLFYLIPYCERFILQPPPAHPTHLHRHARKRIQIYALIGTVAVSRIITSCVGLLWMLYCVSAAEQTASAGAGLVLSCMAVLHGLCWICTTLLSLMNMERLVRMAMKHSGAEAGSKESVSSSLGEKERDKDKGDMVVTDVECAA